MKIRKLAVLTTLFPFLLAAALFCAPPLSAQAPDGASSVKAIDAGDVISEIADMIDQRRSDAVIGLSNVGHGEAVENILSFDGQTYSRFSARTLIETLYRQADATSSDEGRRFLATLVDYADRNSIGLQRDSTLDSYRGFGAERLDMIRNPIRFAPLSELGPVAGWKPIPAAVEGAIELLSEAYSGRFFGTIRPLALRVFKNPGFQPGTFERIVAESPDTRTALRRMIQQGTPPPTMPEAVLELLRHHLSGTMAQEPRFLEVMVSLSRELSEKLKLYTEVEDKMASRQRQGEQAKRAGQRGKIEKPVSAAVAVAINRGPENPDFPTDGRGGPAGGSPFGGAPGVGVETSGPQRSAYASYNTKSFRSGPNPPSRIWSRAIRSSRAARGIAVGGGVDASAVSRPLRAIWYPNAEDGRFGRLFVEVEGEDRVIVSRTMFADSFYAAVGLLWGENEGDAEFREGEILILMSLDPFGGIASELEAKLEQFTQEFQRLEARTQRGENVESQVLTLTIQMLDLLSEQKGKPRDVVIHPALFGRELAWSAVRVDFWFNDLELLSKEAAAMNGGREMPVEFLRHIDFSEAVTWQFYEHDVRIHTGGQEGDAVSLVIDPIASNGHMRSAGAGRFGITMFWDGPTDDSGELPRLEDLKADVQPMLNWLFVNHHDFMRLRDVSDSFALLRWLRRAGASVTVIDMDGQSQAIATPNGVMIGTGPVIVSGSK